MALEVRGSGPPTPWSLRWLRTPSLLSSPGVCWPVDSSALSGWENLKTHIVKANCVQAEFRVYAIKSLCEQSGLS